MRKIIINMLWIILWIIAIVGVGLLDFHILKQYPEMKKIADTVLVICWLIIIYEACKSLYRTKKMIYMVQIVALLIIGYADMVRHHPDYFPSFIKEYQINNMMRQNKNFIDEIFALHKNALNDNFDAFTYCLQVLIEYGRWFEDNKYFIDQRPELKESLRKELKQAISSLKVKTYDKESLGYYIVESFKENIKKIG